MKNVETVPASVQTSVKRLVAVLGKRVAYNVKPNKWKHHSATMGTSTLTVYTIYWNYLCDTSWFSLDKL